MSAFQRFLLDNNKSHFSIKTPQNNNHGVSEGEYLSNGDFNSGFGNTIFGDRKSDLSSMHGMYPNLSLDQNGELLPQENSTSKYFGRKGKGSFIKGQWTDEEDRILIDLVIKHGEKRWAKVAEDMNWRSGKQCRDRWHNNLRPDIKKEIWSEEEERMLIDSHIQVGNKWAEIAKRIPGRTENSVKNHWNTTKRRQNSKRKYKKRQEGQKSKSMLLQEYQIKIFNKQAMDQSVGVYNGNFNSDFTGFSSNGMGNEDLMEGYNGSFNADFMGKTSNGMGNGDLMEGYNGNFNANFMGFSPNGMGNWDLMEGYNGNFNTDFMGFSSNGMGNGDLIEGYNGNFNGDFMGFSNGMGYGDLMEGCNGSFNVDFML